MPENHSEPQNKTTVAAAAGVSYELDREGQKTSASTPVAQVEPNAVALYQRFFNLRPGVLTVKPSPEQVSAIVAQVLKDNGSNLPVSEVLVEYHCSLNIFAQIAPAHDGRVCNSGYVVFKQVSEELAEKLATAIMAAFKVVDLYERHETCPYCHASGESIQHLTALSLNFEPGATDLDNIFYKIEPAVCTKCGLGFNYTGHSQELFGAFCSQEEFTSFLSPMQQKNATDGAFANFLNTIPQYCPNKEGFIVEVGSYDGYLLSKVQELGYQHVLGFEPGKHFPDSLPIYHGYFDMASAKQEVGAAQVDLLFSRNSVECIFDLKSFMDAVNFVLKEGGHIIFQLPNPVVVNSFQFFRLPVAFLERLCHDQNMAIVEVLPNKKPYALNSHTTIVARKLTQSELDELKASGKPLPSVFASPAERAENISQMQLFSGRRSFSPEMLKKLASQVSKVEQELKDKGASDAEATGQIVIYGSGLTTNKILAGLLEQGYNFDYSKWVVVDSNPAKEGFSVYAPDGSTIAVKYAGTYLKNKEIGLLIFGVQNPVYVDEINSTLSELGCHYHDHFYQDYLQG